MDKTKKKNKLQTIAVATKEFTWLMVFLSTLLIVGLYCCGWDNTHNLYELGTPFTPWQIPLYTGFFLTSGTLLISWYRNIQQGYHWKNAAPLGYGLSTIGIAIIACGWLGDILWQLMFGIASNLEAFLSPTRLIISVGIALVLLGPFRSSRLIKVSEVGYFQQYIPSLLSMSYVLALLSYCVQYIHPFAHTVAAISENPTHIELGAVTNAGFEHLSTMQQAIGLAGIMVATALLATGTLLLALHWKKLPFGSFSVLLLSSTVGLVVINEKVLTTGVMPIFACIVAAGIITDFFNIYFSPTIEQVLPFRIFLVSNSVVLYTLYFLTILIFGGGIWWSPSLWAGAIILAGTTTVLVSYVAIPPGTT
ncbi:MAG: hypothetical protein WCP97_04125 [bacterium]